MEGFLRYDFGGLIFTGAYTWRGLFSEFYGMLNRSGCSRLGIPKEDPVCFNRLRSIPVISSLLISYTQFSCAVPLMSPQRDIPIVILSHRFTAP